ncbi:MAG: phosphatase PAP2 family protein [Chloroflexi bacterium]|nr:phosphatase PAP2 family protein [Chloroflexota bacterium]
MDTWSVLSLHQLETSSATFATVVALIAEAGIFILPIALLCVWLVARAPTDRRREPILVGVAAAVVSLGVGLLLERMLARPRPFVELGLAPLFGHAPDSSFPSDHTLVGVALIGPLLWRAPKVGIWLLAWALIVGFARVAASIHYPTDVVGSALLALALDGLVWVATGRIRSRLNLQRWDGARPGSRRRGPRRETAE